MEQRARGAKRAPHFCATGSIAMSLSVRLQLNHIKQLKLAFSPFDPAAKGSRQIFCN